MLRTNGQLLLVMDIRTIKQHDYAALSEIYREGINSRIATFEKDVPPWEVWDKSHLPNGRIAVYDTDEMMGWAALTGVSNRCIYAGVAEVSVYVGIKFRGQGIGEILLNGLIAHSEQAGIWTLQSAIFEENTRSIKLHQKCGFRMIGFREKIGKIDGVWKNNVLMERRSKTVGNND